MTNYHAYLIRFWRENEQQPWRTELVSPHTGEERRFATVAQAYAFLEQQLHNPEDPVSHQPLVSYEIGSSQ